ncbi:hypothetical protein [Amycolatopsis sp. NPDC051372]
MLYAACEIFGTGALRWACEAESGFTGNGSNSTDAIAAATG